MANNALSRQQQNALMIANAEPGYGDQRGQIYPPTLSPYNAPWYQELPNSIGDGVDAVRGAFGAEPMGPEGREYMRKLFGTQNPLNVPGQVHEGIDTALGGYAGGDVGRMAGGVLMAAMPFVPMPGKLPASAVKPRGIRGYHGSPHDFEKFEGTTWLSNDEGYAEGLAGRSLRNKTAGHMYEVQANVKSPYVVDVMEEATRVAKTEGMPLPSTIAEAESMLYPHGYPVGVKSYMPEVKKGGHDSIHFKGTDDGFGRKTDQYVVFDDKLIEILRKYGLAGLMAGGAASQQGDGQQ